MSDMFPSAYGLLFIGQLIMLLVAYIVLRFRTKLDVLTASCTSVLIVAALTLLPLFLRLERYIHLHRVDLEEYVAGTCTVAAPFTLILILKFLVPFVRGLALGQKAASPERARILQMIEDGKITAEEGSDLLEAMGKSSALRGQDKFSSLDVAILAGVALVVLGFFLPWVHIRLSSMTVLPGIQDIFNQNSAYQAGYHTGAIGWMIFAIALVSAIPVFVTPKSLLYKISLLHLFVTLIGLLLVFMTLLRAGNQLGAGIVTCAVGFTIELIASGAKFRHLAA
jgi:hypothetical protein